MRDVHVHMLYRMYRTWYCSSPFLHTCVSQAASRVHTQRGACNGHARCSGCIFQGPLARLPPNPVCSCLLCV